MKLRRFFALLLPFVLVFPLFGCMETAPEGMVTVYLVSTKIWQGNEEQAATTYTYDSLGNKLTETKYANDREQWRIEYTSTDCDAHTGYIKYYPDGYAHGYRYVCEFDGQGRPLSTVTYEIVNGSEYIWDDYFWEYDEFGNVIRNSSNYEVLDGISYDLPMEITYQYDANGNKIECLDDNLRTVYEYSGDLLMESVTYNDGEERTRNTYTYDKQGNRIAQEYYVRGNYEYSRLFSYDDKGNLIWESTKDISSNTTSLSVYSYNSDGKILTESYYSNETDSEPYKTYEYTYDKDGTLAKMVQKHGESVCTTTYKYTKLYMTPEQAERFRDDTNALVVD